MSTFLQSSTMVSVCATNGRIEKIKASSATDVLSPKSSPTKQEIRRCQPPVSDGALNGPIRRTRRVNLVRKPNDSAETLVYGRKGPLSFCF
jgi:hypothetical protein